MYSIFRVGSSLLACLVSATALLAAPPAPTFPAVIEYNPAVKLVQGNQPLAQTYTLTIKGPHTIVDGSPVIVALGFTVLGAPPGLSGTAMGFVSAYPSQLTFTTASQIRTTEISVNVPLGNYAGDYSWRVKPISWPAELNVQTDLGATLNAVVAPVITNPTLFPTVVITSPAPNAEFVYSPATGVPVSFPIHVSASVGTGGGLIGTLGATINDAPVLPMTFTPTGLGSLDATGTATSPNLTVAGTYVIRAFATNIAGTTYAEPVTIRVLLDTSTPPLPPFCANLMWLTPISHDKVVSGGSTVPIKFTLSCDRLKQKFVRDESLVIVIYEVLPGGERSAAVIYPYGKAGPNPPDYAIDGNHYHLNFPTARGAHHYHIDVYHPLTPAGTPLQLLGSKELYTR